MLAVVAISAVIALAIWGAVSAVRTSDEPRSRHQGRRAVAQPRWPATAAEEAGLAAMVALFVAGIGAAAFGIARAVSYGRHASKRERELERLERAALTDNLTGMRNHRAFHEDLAREIERRNRTGANFAIAMIDLNGLKKINDTHGHQAGDARIRAAAECLEESVRGSDTGYRTGGDEFMVLLPDARAWGALTFAHRLHATAAAANVSVAVGITESTRTESRDTLIRQADLALYEAKRSKLKTIVYNPGLDPHPAKSDRDELVRHQKTLATALARAVDAKDAGTRNHCETVAALCALIARELGLPPEHIERVRLAGLLHDVGKIGIADAILQKPAKLLREERAIMSTHTTIGHNIVSAADLEEEADWVLHHHERWDGLGYPDGLAGEAIPLESRIILTADAFEAITSDRPYRAGRSQEEALQELTENAGSQFDPRCVAALCAVFGHGSGLPLDELNARRLLRVDHPAPARARA
jgi:diguanylate cyclase (GGDEF)-like protein/putative nucleotidyltransferase with HDIG domain